MNFLALWGICSFIALGPAIVYLGDKKNQDMNHLISYVLAFFLGPVVLGFILQDIANSLSKIAKNSEKDPL